ncbi:hypothetical protein C8F04DRAFT_992847 [Mycena alexandri]|uniref:FAS1 domain-containing protein n=1 Tax=Mycena alexandri TaxID=1745969 RepID=A0AAD6TBV9_9AGAR|nr:hypothetical protein C8F04DRAFT_992847 [Mycena alexandri]
MLSHFLISLVVSTGSLARGSAIPSADQVDTLPEYAPPQVPLRAQAAPQALAEPKVPKPRSIYQILANDPEFSNISWSIRASDEVTALLNSSSSNLTFFATPDWALQPCDRDPEDDEAPECRHVQTIFSELAALMDDSSETEDALQEMVTSILKYNILPAPVDVLAQGNSTYSTLLTLLETERPQRIRVAPHSAHKRRKTTINAFTHIVWANIKASNGVIHVIDRTLALPVSIVGSLARAPVLFSTLSAALKQSGVSNSLEGNKTATLFAPTNRAFKRLPKGLQQFLFSPEGAVALQKLLEFHVVPDIVLHSDYIYNASSKADAVNDQFLSAEAGLLRPKSHHRHARKQDHVHEADDCDEDEDDFSPHLRPRKAAHKHRKHHHKKARWSASRWFAQFLRAIGLAPESLLASKDISIKPPRPPHPHPHGHHPHPHGHHPHPPHMHPVYTVNLTLPTELRNHSLHIHIAKFEGHSHHPPSKFFVDGRPVRAPDFTASNGAIHVVGRILDPRGPHGQHRPPKRAHLDAKGSWENWEGWFPQWALEA